MGCRARAQEPRLAQGGQASAESGSQELAADEVVQLYVRDLVANREVMIDTLPVWFDRDRLARCGLTPGEASHQVETAFRGRTLGTIHRDGARYDLVVRLDEAHRKDIDNLQELYLDVPGGGKVPLDEVADMDL